MSLTLSMACGSGESLNASVSCGFSPNAHQMRLPPTGSSRSRPPATWSTTSDLVDPMRRVCRLLLERLHDHPLHVGVADRAWLPRPRLVMQTVEAAPREPTPPLADRVVVTAKLGRDLLARPALRRRQ